jgi:lipid-A-disaccharide synthase
MDSISTAHRATYQKCVLIIVGEASGDLHASKVVKALRKDYPNWFFIGIGGSALKRAGVRILTDISALTAVGVTESLAKLPQIFQAMARVKQVLKSVRPDLLILVDFPDFNLRVAPTAKKLDIPVLYYISPQLWAWRAGRAKKLKILVDHLAVILPFEVEFYQKYQIPVTFVGHPLLDAGLPCLNTDLEKKCNQSNIIGLLSGSRDREVERHLPVMLDAALILFKHHPELKFVISVAHTVEREMVKTIVDRYNQSQIFELTTEGVGHIFNRVKLVLATSGTVTLEAALYGVPEVIIYKVSPISYWAGRTLIKVSHIGLANLIAGKEIVPELIQKDATPKNIADVVERMLSEQSYIKEMMAAFRDIRGRLGGAGACDRVADIVTQMLNLN